MQYSTYTVQHNCSATQCSALQHNAAQDGPHGGSSKEGGARPWGYDRQHSGIEASSCLSSANMALPYVGGVESTGPAYHRLQRPSIGPAAHLLRRLLVWGLRHPAAGGASARPAGLRRADRLLLPQDSSRGPQHPHKGQADQGCAHTAHALQERHDMFLRTCFQFVESPGHAPRRECGVGRRTPRENPELLST